MHERYLGHMEPDMDVCDMNGDKLGSVAHVYRHQMAAVTAGDTMSSSVVPDVTRDEFVEVKTGFLGLGKHLYVPFSEIQEVTQGCIFLGRSKEDIERLDWTTKPDYLDQLT